MKFKIGDKVRRVNRDNGPDTPIGHVGTVTGLADFPHLIEVDGDGWYAANTELISEQSELEQLVATANEGRRAVDMLFQKHKEKFEFYPGTGVELALDSSKDHLFFHKIGSEFRIKPPLKPVFEPFRVGTLDFTGHAPWLVELRDYEQIAIGCKEFDVKDLYRCLIELCVQQKTNSSVFRAVREGVCHSPSHNTLSWADADRVLEVLNKITEEGK